MKQLYYLFIITIISACSTPGTGLFSSKAPREAYEDKIIQLGLHKTALGMEWSRASQTSLQSPVAITLPYAEKGFFAAEKPRATGYRFSAKRGESIRISLQVRPDTAYRLFLELWSAGQKQKLLKAADSTNTIEYEINEEGSYLLRLQPELLAAVSYDLEVSAGPSLAFPVPASTRPRVSSFWGDNRDAGKRSHEGVDIFAPKRTPLLAAAGGTVYSVTENRLGGKVVFLRPKGKNYSLYYAHLDEQLVKPGQSVNVGDTIGLMGNTGNAQTTPPHLHFGIYTSGGAIDPFPFINNNRPALPGTGNLPYEPGVYIRTTRQTALFNGNTTRSAELRTLPSGSIMQVAAKAPGNMYHVLLPDGIAGFVPASYVSSTEKPFRNYTLRTDEYLTAHPDPDAPYKLLLSKGSPVQALGRYNGHLYVRQEGETGWLKEE